jgi:hypothetical protein
MGIDSETAGAAIVLFFVTTGVIMGILYAVRPATLVTPDNQKFLTFRALGMSIAFAAVFAFIVAHISVQVDMQFARKQLLLAKVGAAK